MVAVNTPTGKLDSFPSMPNFRQINDFSNENNNVDVKNKLYRSSRPDFLSVSEVKSFKNLNIKSIIDFRSHTEYKKANGNKLLDHEYPLYKVHFPFTKRYKPNSEIKAKRIKTKKSGTPSNVNAAGKHYLVDFFQMNYVVAVFNRAPWYVRLYSILYLICDLILNTGYQHFIRLFARNVLNNKGLTGQYIDMLTYSQAPICSALKILSKPENLPAMINCAHGKDRTGLVTALTLSCLGKPKEYIINDYAKSQVGLEPIKDRVYDEIVNRFHMSEKFLGAHSEDLLGALEFIEFEYGSIPNYLEYIGFSRTEQEQLRRNLCSCD